MLSASAEIRSVAVVYKKLVLIGIPEKTAVDLIVNRLKIQIYVSVDQSPLHRQHFIIKDQGYGIIRCKPVILG